MADFGPRPTVFIVDDIEPNVRLLERILGQADLADVRGFVDARDALSGVTGDLPDLILLDLHMPRLDGFEFLAALDEKVPDDDLLPVLAITADVDRATRRRALGRGASDFLTKPFDADEVVARCRNLLRMRRLHRTLRERNRELKGELDDRTSTLVAVQRERDAIAASVAELGALETAEATALRICSQLIQVAAVDAATVVHFTPDGSVVALASAGLRINASSDLRSVPEALARDLRERAGSGPWVEEQVATVASKPFRAQLARAGAVSAIYAPIRASGDVVGLVVAMTAESRSATQLVERLPAVVEYAAVAGAVIGPQLAARVDRARARRNVEAIIEARALRTVFQPIIGLATDEVVGFEALTRFDDGTPPDRRFQEAASAGMGTDLELACLRVAIQSADRLPRDCWLSVNVSPRLVVEGNEVHALLAGSQRPMVLEVTEHSPVDDYHGLRRAIRQVAPSARLAIDDAGAGFASFRHILELRPSFVKLDLGLIRGIDADPARRALVAGMEYFATQTGVTLIAEGIETPKELAALVDLGVPLGQGYLLGRPDPVEIWQGRRASVPSTRVAASRHPTPDPPTSAGKGQLTAGLGRLVS